MAPNLTEIEYYLYRPAMASPPLCSFVECKALTLKDLVVLHDILDLRGANAEKLAKRAEAQQRRGR